MAEVAPPSLATRGVCTKAAQDQPTHHIPVCDNSEDVGAI
jgi:hypothetical protein